MFSALLAHDLRNPLSAILASAQLLKRRNGDGQVQEGAARILTSGQHMRRLIEDMLDLARARLAGGIVIKRERVDLETLDRPGGARASGRRAGASRRTSAATAIAWVSGMPNASRRSRPI